MDRPVTSEHAPCDACRVPARTPFASNTVLEHLARGVGAILLILLATILARSSSGWETTIPVAGCWVGAVVLLRGCPMCWVIGLVETVRNRLSRE